MARVVTPADLPDQRRSISGLTVFGDMVAWAESRPEEGGAQVVVGVRLHGWPSKAVVPERISKEGVSVRTRVHEYGGASFCIDDSCIFYVEQSTQALFAAPLGAKAGRVVRLTPEPPAGEEHRYAAPALLGTSGWLVALLERHDPHGVSRSLVAVEWQRRLASAPEGSARDAPWAPVVLDSGRDFYGAPRLSPDGQRLAWVCWDHPFMPWDESELRLALVGWEDHGSPRGAEPSLGEQVAVAGGKGVSVGQPTWSTGGDQELCFVCDARGWWQPWRAWQEWSIGAAPRGEEHGPEPWRDGPVWHVEQISTLEAEFHSPDWALGQSTLVALPSGELACRFRRDGRDHLAVMDPRSGLLSEVDQPLTSITALAAVEGSVVAAGSSPTASPSVWLVSTEGTRRPVAASHVPDSAEASSNRARQRSDRERGEHRGIALVASPARRRLDPATLSWPSFLMLEADFEPGIPVLYYPPAAPGQPRGAPIGATRLREGGLPPLVVSCHGGPTGSFETGFDLHSQMLAAHGFAVAHVDYRGSAGYGRRYRRMLDGLWGVADVEDVARAAVELARLGLADASRMAVRGASAGGYTALRAGAYGGCFKAVVSLYGVTDLVALREETHDFESRYLDTLVAPYPAGEAVYLERSVSLHAEDLRVPTLLLQGRDDPVVPLAQATAMADSLSLAGIRCELVVFDGEGHGFRRAETIVEASARELAFLCEALGVPLV
jgi:acetyl esterase/lipase